MPPPTIYAKALWPNEIRLMVLLPGQWKDPVSCELRIGSLAKKRRRGEYRALSYAWGLKSRSNPPKIQVGDMLLPITVNLDCALRHVRRPDEPVVLWVDAVCINQADANERTSQVSRMADIYREATEVIVFLGGGPGRQMKGFKKQKDPGPCTVFTNTPLDDTLTNQALLNWTTPGRRQQITAFDLFCLLRILSQSREASDPFEALREVPDVYLTAMFESLRQMLTTRWWDRIWVVQEAVIAKKITLRYGNVSAPWEMAAEAALTHLQRARNDHNSPVSQDDIKVLNLLSRVQDIDNFRRTWGENDRPNILSLLREFSNRKASDERDKVYALLGLCDQHTGIRPDYSSEVRETYMLATIDIILHSQSLSVLTGDLGRKERRDLPSWVPDWSATFDEHDRKRVRLFNHYNACGNVKGRILEDDRIGRHIEDELASLAQRGRAPTFLLPLPLSVIFKWYKSAHPEAKSDCDRVIECCHSDSQRDVKTLIDYSIIEFEPFRWEGCLKVSGSYIGTVWKTMSPIYSSSDMNAVSDAITAWYKQAELSNFRFRAFNRKGFVSTILSDVKKTAKGFKRLGPDDERAMSHWYRHTIERKDLDWEDPDVAPPSPETLDALTEVMRLSVTNRTFFITQDGKMGLGPASIAKDDEIHILPGGKLPFVLRSVKPPATINLSPHYRKPRAFNLVGDCFIHGGMDPKLDFRRAGGPPANLLHQVMVIFQQNWGDRGRDLGARLGLKVRESQWLDRGDSSKQYEWPENAPWPEITSWFGEYRGLILSRWEVILKRLMESKENEELEYMNSTQEKLYQNWAKEMEGGRAATQAEYIDFNQKMDELYRDWGKRKERRAVERAEYTDITQKMDELYRDWVKLTEVGYEVEKGFIYLV